MSDSSCLSAGCPFSGGGKAGPCTGTSGILSAAEIEDVIASGATVSLDAAAAVKIVTWDTNQWVSYDDAETMKMKINFANQHCLGGYVFLVKFRHFNLANQVLRTMIWAVDMDTRNGTSIDFLGSDLSREKSPTYSNNDTLGEDYGWS